MDLDELQSVRDRERQTDKLQQLRPTFYADAGEFIQQLREQRSRAAERADDPFDAPEVSRLSDEIDTAEQTVEAIYEKRVGKIVKAASFAAADLPAESDGMTEEELKLFETLVADIKENRQHVLDVLAGDTDEASAGEAAESTAATEPTAPIASGAATPEGTASGAAADNSEAPADDADAPADDPESPEPPESGPEDSTAPQSTAESALTDGPPTGLDDGDDGPSEVSAAEVMGGEADSEAPSKAEAERAGESRSEDAPEQEPPAPTSGTDDAGREDESERAVREDGGTAAASSGVDRETVRITADVGDIFGVDEREYDLAEDDVVTLPEANAKPLVERDAAERL
jgi:DNA replication factor GINS